MNYNSLRQHGASSFKPDPERGHWATVGDFIFVSVAMAFRSDFSSIARGLVFEKASGIVPHLISLALLVVPLMMIQSFLGQFSSSGYISALRISPMFKAIGYVSLLLNFGVLTYYSIFAATPLFYLVHALRPILPWSCEAFQQWSFELPQRDNMNICNLTAVNGSLGLNAELQLPSVIFYRQQFNVSAFGNVHKEPQSSISWQLVACTLVIWLVVAYILKRFHRAEKLGHLLHFLTWLTLTLLTVCLARFLLLPNASKTLRRFFHYDWASVWDGLRITPLNALQVFGPGWGSLLSVASFNRFKTDIGRHSWLIGLVQMLILFAFLLISSLIEGHLREFEQESTSVMSLWLLFLSSGSVLASMDLPNLWSLLFYGMMTLSNVVVMVIHVHSFFTAIFDEFAALRQYRLRVTLTFIGIWCVLSLYSCTAHGILFYTAMIFDGTVIQIAFDLLVLLVVLWIYGRERFQSDIQFMLGYAFPTWKVHLLRFGAPFALIAAMLSVMAYSKQIHFLYTHPVVNLLCILCLSLPWLIVPLHTGYSLAQMPGALPDRWRKICVPRDWHPVDLADRLQYEQAFADDSPDDPKREWDDVTETILLP